MVIDTPRGVNRRDTRKKFSVLSYGDRERERERLLIFNGRDTFSCRFYPLFELRIGLLWFLNCFKYVQCQLSEVYVNGSINHDEFKLSLRGCFIIVA